MEGVGGVSPVSGCCGLKLKKSPSPGGAQEAWQHEKRGAQEMSPEAQRSPERVTRREVVGPEKKMKKNASDQVLVRINCNDRFPQRWNWPRGWQTWAQPLGWPLSHQVC